MVPPRSSSSRATGAAVTSSPLMMTRPSISQFAGNSRIRARNVTLLPEPDSPSIPSISPRPRRKLTPLTAWIVRSRWRNLTARSATSIAIFSVIDGGNRVGAAMARAGNHHVTGDIVVIADRLEDRRCLRTDRLGKGAAGTKAAARRRVDRVGRVAGQRRDLGAVVRIHARHRPQQGSRIRV